MTKVQMRQAILDNFTQVEIALINTNIYYVNVDYYIWYHAGEYQRCYDFLTANRNLLTLDHTPPKFLEHAQKILAFLGVKP